MSANETTIEKTVLMLLNLIMSVFLPIIKMGLVMRLSFQSLPIQIQHRIAKSQSLGNTFNKFINFSKN
jgi:hypothetical protein